MFFCIFSWQFLPYPRYALIPFHFYMTFFADVCWFYFTAVLICNFSRCGLVAVGPSYPLPLYDTGLPLPGLWNSGGWFGIFVTILYKHSNKKFIKKFSQKLDNQTKERKLALNEKNSSNLLSKCAPTCFWNCFIGAIVVIWSSWRKLAVVCIGCSKDVLNGRHFSVWIFTLTGAFFY